MMRYTLKASIVMLLAFLVAMLAIEDSRAQLRRRPLLPRRQQRG
ncbi:MAG: hypothetical protein QM811_20895 [Pirellulales bacterium]